MRPVLNSDIETALCRDDPDRGVIPGSLVVVREKQVGGDVVVAATFRRREQAGVRRACIGLTWSDLEGWHSAGGAWSSSVVDDRPAHGLWLDWGGWGPGAGNGLHVLSGWLADPRAVSLSVSDGLVTVQDRVENGVAILLWRGDFSTERGIAELRDAADDVFTREPLQPR